MSTQRREIRWQRTGCTACAEASANLGDRSWSQGLKVAGHASPSPGAQPDRTNTSGVTAPPATLAWLAINSLQSDHFNEQLVRQDIRRGLPPPGAARAATGVPADAQVILSAHLHPARFLIFPSSLAAGPSR